MLTRDDFKPSLPDSLKELVVSQLIPGDKGTLQSALTEDGLEQLMKKVYEKIEAEALAVFKSNEVWALKAWAYSTILKDTIASEANQAMVEELMSPVVEWQNQQPFDSIGYFRELLEAERKSDRTKECYILSAARFVGMIGRKRHYTNDDIMTYLKWASKHYQNQDSYYQECRRLLQFLRRLPGADRQRQLPMRMPKMPSEFYQPTFTNEDVEILAWSTVLDNIPYNMVVRLAVASIYGARRSELTQLSSEDISLDGGKGSIFIRTKKGGQRKPQPIPQSLFPLFCVPVTPMHGHTIQRQLKKICKDAGVHLPSRGGYHCFRRRTVTTISEVEPSDTNVSNFMRWAKPRTMLARYKQTPVEVTDTGILAKHPFVKMWSEIIPYLLEFNSSYSQFSQPALNDNT